MEVSQIAGLDTHAIIGGGKAHAFTMSESAEFFTVLSDTLYRDKKRAVVREVTCNAWDAHIVAGKNVPVEITLTDATLTIKDFGPGIPTNKIGAIYCRYGASTKVADENQTGGFGLGSKAPFAYSDHFTVTNCHDGKKRIYAVSRGGVETDGKPDFREMAAAPTEETGVTVSIPLRTAEDRYEFEKLIRQIVRNGGMKATLNGETLEFFDYEQTKGHGFALLTDARDLRESSVYCLYGTVIYPVLSDSQEVTKAALELTQITGNIGRVILVAPPNSVGVTPSRESLSYTDKTNKTLVELMERATKLLNLGMKPVAKKLIFKAAAKIVEKRKEYETIWNHQITAGDLRNVSVRNMADYNVFTLNEIVHICASHHVGSLVRNQHRVWRLAFAKADRDNRRIFRRAAYKPDHKETWSNPTPARINGFRIDSRLHTRIASRLGILNNLYACVRSGHSNAAKFYKIDVDIPSHTVVRSKIFISFNQRDAINHIAGVWGGRYVSYDQSFAHMVFVLKRGQHGMIEKIKAEAKHYGIETVEIKITPPPKRESRPKKELHFHSLADLVDNKFIKSETLVTAKYYVRVGSDHYSRRYLPAGVSQYKKDVIELFGDVAVATDAKQEAKLKLLGAISVIDAMADFLKDSENTVEAHYGYMAARGFIHRADYGIGAHIVDLFCKNNLAATLEFFPPKIKHGAVMQRAYKISQILNQYFENGDGHTKAGKVVHDALKAKIEPFVQIAKKNFGHLILSRSAAREKFDYLRCIGGMSYTMGSSSDFTDDLIAVIRFLSRRNAAKIAAAKKKAAEDKRIAAAFAALEASKKPIPKSRALVIATASQIEKEAA